MVNSTKRRTTSKVLEPMVQKLKAKKPRNTKRSPRISLTLSYIPISHHIYYDGCAFRVRVHRNGKTTSFSTRDKKKALKYRDTLLSK